MPKPVPVPDPPDFLGLEEAEATLANEQVTPLLVFMDVGARVQSRAGTNGAETHVG